MYVSRVKIFILAAAVLLALAVPAFAGDVADYERRVRSARAGITLLLANIGARESGEEPDEADDVVFAEMRSLIPASERIEDDEGVFETANEWFVDSLGAAERETDLAKRAEILNELDGRLSAISLKLEELGNQRAAERSKDEDKRKLSEILNRPEYQRPVKEEAADESNPIKDLLERLVRWLESLMPDIGPISGGSQAVGAVGVILRFVIIGGLILLLGFIIYKLAPLFAPVLRRRLEKQKKEDRVIMGERIDDDISSADLFGDAERLAREGDLRGAIRKGYVALLCELSDRKLIGLARHKTNRDYLRDIRSRRDIFPQVNGLTGSFERHWYGTQEAAADDWEEFRNRCMETVKAL